MKETSSMGKQHRWRIFIPVVAAAAIVVTAILTTFSARTLRAQDSRAQVEAQPTLHVEVGPNDQVAASMTSDYRVHILASKFAAGNLNRFSPLAQPLPTVSSGAAGLEQNASDFNVLPLTVPSLPAPGFYPSDLTNPSKGTVVTSAQSNPVYVNCPVTCWGTPATFLTNLDASTFLHLTDQYTGLTTSGRYTLGTAASATYPVFTALSDNDILQIVHAAASLSGTGYTHIYHVFLPMGVDVCFTGTSQCYSPDNLPTFVFCAYHSSVTFSDIGHVLFTVEPFQNVSGCSVAQPSPNGALIDSTSSVLSHETFETITDPDPPNGWVAQTTGVVAGAEIGDLCETLTFKYGNFTVNGKSYEIQPEYSNKYHGCATVP